MPFEKGGRADKLGNRYEFNWIVLKFIDIVAEKIIAIKIEAIGDEELGVDVWLKHKNGLTEAQQCKGRNASKEYWTLSDIYQKGIIENWKKHLERDNSNIVSLVSPLPFKNFSDLIYRARTNDSDMAFIKNQVNGSPEIKKIFDSYVKYLGLSIENDLQQVVKFLSRTEIRQEPYPEDEEYILDKINQYFIGDALEIKSKLINLITQGSIYGKWISFFDLNSFFVNEKIELRKLIKDNRILPRIETLNSDYRRSFNPLKKGLIIRSQLEECKDNIIEGKSIVIHGKAGNGKSGLTENIIDWCNENQILHLDVKLDSHIPQNSAELWGKELGFSTSISYCLDAFSKNKPAVLILDQLDSLRWTAKNSKNSIATCLDVIREIRTLNLERKHKISIILVCRSYDLEYDNGIKSLFEKDVDDNSITWNRIEVNEFSEKEVINLLGNKYEQYPHKLKSLLLIPSNLYIWEQIENESNYYQITSTYALVNKWWRDLLVNSYEAGINENELNDLKNNLIRLFTVTGETVFSKRRIHEHERAFRFLISHGLLVERNNKISFVHQSFLDCFVADQMMINYYSNLSIGDIAGNRSQQNPTRRYQFQIFLQSLLEESENEFLHFGNKLIKNYDIRFNFKYVFFEILGSIKDPSKKILEYVRDLIQDIDYRQHLCQTVVKGNSSQVNFLVKQGVISQWLKEDQTLAITLLSSISPYFESESISLLSQCIENSSDKNVWRGCFLSDYHNDSEEFFKLRLKYWKYINENLYWHEKFYKNINNFTLQIVQLLIENFQEDSNSKQFYSETKEFDKNSKKFISQNYNNIIQLLLPYASKFSKINSTKYNFALTERDDLQKYYVDLLHEANMYLVANEPEEFFIVYCEYLGRGDHFFNEIILDALYYLPDNYADKCIEYLISDFDKTLFEKSEGYERKMVLAKRLVSKVSEFCSEEMYSLLEDKIIHYISPDALSSLQNRIDKNKSHLGYKVYWPFWGELQYQLLSVIPNNKRSDEANELLQVFEHDNKFLNTYYDSQVGSVISPLQGKKISYHSWEKLLISQNSKKQTRWDGSRNVFVESSPEEFSKDFRNIVSQEPMKYIPLYLSLSAKNEINSHYLDGLLGGIEDLEEVPDNLITDIEFILLNFVSDNNWQNLYHFFNIIEKNPSISWSQNILNKFNEYLVNTSLDNLDKNSVSMNLENYAIQSYSTIRGYAIRALDKLISYSSAYITFFKQTIRKLAADKTHYVRFNSIFLIATILESDREFAKELFELVFDNDTRMFVHWNSNYIFFNLYDDFEEMIKWFLILGYESEEEVLVKKSSSLILEIYLNKGKMKETVYNAKGLQAITICQMAIRYFKIKKYKKQAKEVILYYIKQDNIDLKNTLPQLFGERILDIREDKDIILDLLKSKYKTKLYYYFLKYLEEQVIIKDYEEIVLDTVSEFLASEIDSEIEPLYLYKSIEEKLSRLMLNLYDEHKEDGVSQQCLDIIDQMFEKEFGDSRVLINELMQK
ncbi:hypothetical protein [Streptococcus uberis]|uniref:hypothetical protein n=2 Tax=Streptococcus uberis TaxID=1349 RepID=UPI0012B5657B|nr:hypothetical protein [Streptococcus uberis]MTB97931.1 hypothetical protein [Streptococcus uberis]